MSPEDHADALAAGLRGNWKRFESFGWHARPDDADDWCIVYTSNRDADALTRSNAAVIARRMAHFGDDCRAETHHHWAVGWVSGYAIRVCDATGNLTPAFREWSAIECERADYPVLDDSHFSETEETEACEVWANCYSVKGRIEYIRKHRGQFEFRSLADMVGSVRGKYFGGYASELLS